MSDNLNKLDFGDDDSSQSMSDLTTTNNECISYWESFCETSHFVSAFQVQSMTRDTIEVLQDFLPQEPIDSSELGEAFGISGLVRYTPEYYPLNWKKPYRQLSVDEKQVCVHTCWNDENNNIRCLSVILSTDWRKSSIYPENALYSVYSNAYGVVIHDKESISPKEAFHILKSDDVSCEISDFQKHLELNTFHSCYVKLDGQSFHNNGNQTTRDGSIWSLTVEKKALVRTKWEKFVLSDEDYAASKWKEVKIDKKKSREQDLWCLKYQRAVHPRLPIKRTVAYLAKTHTERVIISSVLLQYSFLGDSIEPESFKINKKPKVSPDLKATIQKESRNRRKVDVYKTLKDEGYNVTKSMVYNALRDSNSCPDVIKGKTGPTSNLSVEELFKAVGKHDGVNVHMGTGDKTYNIIGQASVTFESNLRLFLECAPTQHDLTEYRKLVDHIATLDSSDERTAYYNATFPPMLNNSGCIESVASNLHVDTTYNISNWLVTIVYGSIKQFSTTNGMKMRYIILSICWHLSRTKEVHEQHARDIEKIIKKLPKNLQSKAVSCFMTDREPALKAYREISVCRMAVHLHCFFHLRENMMKNRKKGVGYVFGVNTKGGVEGALLCTLHKDDYDDAYEALMERREELDSHLYEFLVKNKDELWARYSLVERLYAAMPQHYASNNVLEQFNQKIKNDGSGVRAVQESVHWFMKLNRESVDEIIRALMGISESITYMGKEIWENLSLDDQDDLLRNLGLSRLLDPKFEKLPDGFVSSVGVNRLYQADLDSQLTHSISEYEHQIGKGFHILSNLTMKTVTVQAVDVKGVVRLVCTRKGCPPPPLKFCDHQLLCFMQLTLDQQIAIASKYMEEDSLNDKFLAEKNPSNGKKPNKRRHMLQSKSNHPRGIRMLARDEFIFTADAANETVSPASFQRRLARIREENELSDEHQDYTGEITVYQDEIETVSPNNEALVSHIPREEAIDLTDSEEFSDESDDVEITEASQASTSYSDRLVNDGPSTSTATEILPTNRKRPALRDITNVVNQRDEDSRNTRSRRSL